MADERNFRSTYYEKVGCRGVEERKSLEILLKEKPLNLTKLTQFCIRFTVPKIHRTVLWNSLLGNLGLERKVPKVPHLSGVPSYLQALHRCTISHGST